MRRTLESIQWGLFCTSSWTWCIGMYLPFILLRLWGWPGFWAFFIPNVLGCAAFGLVLDARRSRSLAARLGWACALFSAFTVAYQCYFAGWAAQSAVAGKGGGEPAAAAMRTVAATGVPIVLLVAGLVAAGRGDAFWRTVGTAVTLLTPLVVLLPGGTGANGGAPIEPILPEQSLLFAFPTIAFGFLLSPYLDLTFHRAAQEAPSPRIAFATFGLAFAAMLLLVASFHDPATGSPRPGAALLVLWGVQLAFTVGAHLRELLLAGPGMRIPASATGSLVALGVLLATPAFLFTVGSGLLPGEPLYLAFLGGYGLLFPTLFLSELRGMPRWATAAILLLGLPCYLLGAYEFTTVLMPLPVVAALVAARAMHERGPATPPAIG